MIKKVKESGQAISGINISPVINVALVLVLVLLMTAPILDIPNIPVNLPEAVTEEAKTRNITVSIASDGRLSINSEIVTINELAPKLRRMLKKDRGVVVIIRADKDCMYGDVENILRIIKNQARAKKVAIATKQAAKLKE